MATKLEGEPMDRDEAGHLIGRAAQIDLDESEKLTQGDVIAAAREVGVSQKALEAAARERAQRGNTPPPRRRSRGMWVMLVLAVLVLSAVGTLYVIAEIERPKLAARWASVQQHRAEVRSATVRQATSVVIWRSRAMNACRRLTPLGAEGEAAHATDLTLCERAERDRDAEIAAAGTRVSSTVHRYDVEVTAYNRLAGVLWWMPLGDLPRHAPYSNEVPTW